MIVNRYLVGDFLKAYFLSTKSHSMIRKISWISLISLTLSVASMVIVLSIMKSLNQRIQNRLLNSEPHVLVTFKRGMDFIKDTPEDSSPETSLEKLWSFLKQDHIEKYIVAYKQDVILRNWNGRFHGAVAIGLKTENLSWYLSKIQKDSHRGEFFRLSSDEVTMGADLADILGVYHGDSVHIVLPHYLIESGVELPKLQKIKIGSLVRSSVSEIDMGYLFYNTDHLGLPLLQNNSQRYQQLQVWLWDSNESERVKQEIQNSLNSLDSSFLVETWQERNASIFFALKLEKFMIGIFLSLAVLVAAFSLLMALALLASQKRKDFILLRLMGYSPSQLKQLLMGLSLGLGSLGLLTGVFLGALVSLYLEWFPIQVLPDIYYDSDISAQLDFPLLLGLILSGFVFIFLASLGLERLLPHRNIGESLKVTP
jgi:lipoprotein-releasing system permease protein